MDDDLAVNRKDCSLMSLMDSDLAVRRRELLRKRLAAAGLAGDGVEARHEVSRRHDRDRAPLSPAQRRMWVLHRADPSGAAYNVCLDLTFQGALDLPALRIALRSLVERHEALRTRYPSGADDLPYQRIDRAPGGEEFPIALVDLRERPEGTADRLIRELAGYRFDLARDWPIRFALYRTAEDAFRLGLLVHHIAWDGGTWSVLSADLSAAYAAAVSGAAMPEAPAIQYGDFAAAWEQRPPGLGQRDYWRKQLTDLPGPLPLPTDRPEDRGEHSGGRRVLVLDDAEGAALRRLAQETGAHPVHRAVRRVRRTAANRSTGRTDLHRSAPPP